MTLDQLATAIRNALQSRATTGMTERRGLPDEHTVIVGVLREHLGKVKREKLEHRISELEAKHGKN